MCAHETREKWKAREYMNEMLYMFSVTRWSEVSPILCCTVVHVQAASRSIKIYRSIDWSCGCYSW